MCKFAGFTVNIMFDFAFNIQFTVLLDVIVAFTLGMLLFLIKVPNTDYAKKLANSKNIISLCFILCGVLFSITLNRFEKMDSGETVERFASIMTFLVTANASVLLSYSMISLLDDSNLFDKDKFYLSEGLTVAYSIALAWITLNENQLWYRIALTAAIVIFLVQCVWHIFIFSKFLKQSIAKLERYYDDDEDQKVRWIRFCYVIMMLTQVFVLVYMCFPSGFMKVYVVWYALFMLYYTSNFITFLGSHKLTLDAFARGVLSGREINFIERRRKKSEPTGWDSLEKALKKWIEEKRFRECDKGRDEIAAQLGTTADRLATYFTTVKNIDFRTWRMELRINDAKKLLLDDADTPISSIGAMVGFTDRSNFHRQFTAIVGCSPKVWREKNGNKK